MTMIATVSDVLRDAQLRLEQAGCETPRLDAEVLLAFVVGCDRAALVLAANERLYDAVSLPSPEGRYHELIERRCAREPVAYITGSREFRRISVAVDRRV